MFKDPITSIASDNSFFKLIASLPSLSNYKLYNNEEEEKIYPTFGIIISNTQSKLTPDWKLKSKYEDNVCETEIYFMNTYSPLKPTFIFQHGLLITNHKANLNAIISKEFYRRFNIVSVKAAWHSNAVNVVSKGLSSFQNTFLMLASSVSAIQEVVEFHKSNSKEKVIVSGTSMGGINASNHFFYFNTADLYFPIVAYPNFGQLIINSKYKNLFSNYDQVARNNTIKECMDIPSILLKEAEKEKIYPILALKDESVPYKDASIFWKGFKTLEYDCGHFDIIKYAKSIRQYILDIAYEASRS